MKDCTVIEVYNGSNKTLEFRVLGYDGKDTMSIEPHMLPKSLASKYDKSPIYAGHYQVAAILSYVRFIASANPQGMEHKYYYGKFKYDVMFRDAIDETELTVGLGILKSVSKQYEDNGFSTPVSAFDSAIRAMSKVTGAKLIRLNGVNHEVGSFDYHNVIRELFIAE